MTKTNRTSVLALLAVLLVPMALSACGKAIGETLNDATITTRVKTALLNDPDIGVLRIDVETNQGVVTLVGTVSTTAEADRAVKIAKTVEGVKDVKSALKITGDSRVVVSRRSSVVSLGHGSSVRVVGRTPTDDSD